MKFTNIRVTNFENAFRGMRNPKESYHLIDSKFGLGDMTWNEADYDVVEEWLDFLNVDRVDIATRDEVFEQVDNWLLENGVLYTDNNCGEYEKACFRYKNELCKICYKFLAKLLSYVFLFPQLYF